MGPTESMLISTSVIWFSWRRQKPCCCALHFINHVFMWTRSGHLTAQTWAFAVARRAPACLFSRTDLWGAVQHASNYFWLFSFARVRLALPALLEGGFPPPSPAVGCRGISAVPCTPFPRALRGSRDPWGSPRQWKGVPFWQQSLELPAESGTPTAALPPAIARQSRTFTSVKWGGCGKTPPTPPRKYRLPSGKRNKRPRILAKKLQWCMCRQ